MGFLIFIKSKSKQSKYNCKWENRQLRYLCIDKTLVVYSPHSPDPLDFFFWGVMKNDVYKCHPTTHEELELSVVNCTRGVTIKTCQKAVKILHCMSLSMLAYANRRGSYIQNIYYKCLSMHK